MTIKKLFFFYTLHLHICIPVFAQPGIKSNTHRRRRRDETVLSRRVGVGGVHLNSQLAHDDCRRIRRCERSRCRDQVYNSAANVIEVGYDVTYDAACL